MPILSRDRIAHISAGAYALDPSPVRVGDVFGSAELEQAVIEFDIDPATIDTSVPVILYFKTLTSNGSSTSAVQRWTTAFPLNLIALNTADGTAVNETTYYYASSINNLDIKDIVADAATAGQTKLRIVLPESGGNLNHTVSNTASDHPTITYSSLVPGGGGGTGGFARIGIETRTAF